MAKSNDSSAVSEYEQLRLQNIKEREELFREVIEAKNLVHKAFKKTTKRKAPSTPKTPKEDLPPRAKSKRISIGKAIKPSVPDQQRRKKPQLLEYKNQKSRVVEKFVEGYDLRTLAPEEIFYQRAQDYVSLDVAKKTFTSYVTNMNVPYMIEGNSNYKKKYINRLSGYRVQSRKGIMCGITCSSIHPSNHMILGCAGNSDGRILLGRIDSSQDPIVEDYSFFIPHTAKIFHQSWDIFDDEKMITSSYDGTVRIFDIRNLHSRSFYDS